MRVFRDFQVLLTALCGLCLALSLLTLIPGLTAYHTDVYAWLGVLFGSYFALRAAFESLRDRTLDVNLLMVLAAGGAVIIGHPEDAAALLFLFSLSSTLESMAMAKTRSAIEGLIRLRPKTALRLIRDVAEEVPVEELQAGDRVRVLPYQAIPSDGLILEGRCEIDESAMTGESRPAEKSEGDPVLGGTQNLDQMLVIQVTTPPRESTLERIVAIVEEAQENKASGERISQWFGKRYTVFVIGAFLFSLAVRSALGQPEAFYSSLILLVALSPCALVISTPASTLSALAYAARRGILVRGGQYIEAAGKIDTVALDKTGTLTEGRPKVVEICIGQAALVALGPPDPDDDGILCHRRGEALSPEAADALRLAAAAEAFSTHPIAEAIVLEARDQGIEVPAAQSHQAFSGMGIVASVGGLEVKIGQPRFFEGDADAMPTAFQGHVKEMQARGLTSVLMRAKEDWVAFGLRDEPRSIAQEFLSGLRSLGVKRVAMLTGDNPATAAAIARDLRIDEVHAGVLPQEKSELLRRWKAEGRTIMMVGDGINDAPALALADIGVAMGGLGSDVALNAADVVLVRDRIDRIPEMMRLGRMTNGIIRTNLIFAAGIIVGLTIASLFFRLPLPLAVVGHEGSTVLVILNGLRLLRGPK
ncbi:MAG TPA: cation-translocating P-type ATPase [Fimbriimonadaceae bacterium]|nr:cation-translocating P-type ATPase [Fimbriimonadaceae bacterium]